MPLDDQDLAKIGSMIEAHDKKSEPWNWLKFLKGPFDGTLWAKALWFGGIFLIEVIIVLSVFGWVKAKFTKQELKPPAQLQTVGQNQGQINTSNETHDNRDEQGGFTILNLSKWFSGKK